MSAKKRKFLERGVIVAIFAVVMVVGALVAQQHPSHNSWKVIGNMGSFGNNKLTATVRIENDTPFANIIAIPNEETPIADRDILDFSAAAMDPLTNAAAAGGRVGNLGYVIVETNYDKWDIVVSTKYGGYLRRPIITNDPDDENEAPIYAPAIPGTQEKAPGKPNAEDIAWDDGDCVDYRVVDGTFPPQRICVEVDSVPARDVSLVGEGRYLKTSINENVRLNLTIGTLGGFGDGDGVYEFFEAMNTVFGNPASGIAAESFANISTGIQNDPATTGRVSLAATLLGGGGRLMPRVLTGLGRQCRRKCLRPVNKF